MVPVFFNLAAENLVRPSRAAQDHREHQSRAPEHEDLAATVLGAYQYVQKYEIGLHFGDKLVSIDGSRKVVSLERTAPDTMLVTVHSEFDMIHVVPPQSAPDFVRVSPLADSAGWVDVGQATLSHTKFDSFFSGGCWQYAQRKDRRRGAQAGAGCRQ